MKHIWKEAFAKPGEASGPVKVCIWCKGAKLLDEYHRAPDTRDGRVGKCKKCMSAYTKPRAAAGAETRRNYRTKNRAKVSAIQKAYRRTKYGRGSALWRSAQQRAQKRGLLFTLPRAWVADRIKSGVCEVTGLRFAELGDCYKAGPFAPSIDRIDPNKGYSEANCRMVVWAFNAAKGSAGTDADVMTMARALLARGSQ